MTALPYLTKDLPGIGGRLKERPDDFQVEEIPLYQPCGQGSHVYFRVRKTGLSTPAAVERIARHLGVRPIEIGFAGLKDAQAVATQWMSLEHADPQKLLTCRDSQLEVLETALHGNKLRAGHLAGNRFLVRVRGVGEAQRPAAEAVLEVLARRGVPNFFGPQRFGARGDTPALGRAILAGDLKEFLALYLGRAHPGDPPDCRAARDAFDAGFPERALARWPRHYANERRALSAYKRKRHAGPAVAAIDKRMRRLFVSAFQSELFNAVLVRRIDTLDQVLAGDLAAKTDTGGVFLVEAPEVEQPRADRFEISPTGPLCGSRSRLAEGEPGEIERQVLQEHQADRLDYRPAGSLKVKGGRRALRFPLGLPQLRAGKDEGGEFLELAFTLPSGCYATVALREILKND